MKRFDISVESVPIELVSVMLGKNAARATPILAFAERRLRSADEMSGRRSNTCEGSPAGIVAGSVAPSSIFFGRRSAGTSAPTRRRSAF